MLLAAMPLFPIIQNTSQQRRRVRFSVDSGRHSVGTVISRFPTMVDDREVIIIVILPDGESDLIYRYEGQVSDA